MTIKELASFTGKTEKTVQRWVAKNNSKMTLSNDKITLVKGQETNLTINQVEAVLRAGSMSKDAVTILMNNAREKTTVLSTNNSVFNMQMFADMMAVSLATALKPIYDRLDTVENAKPKQLPLPVIPDIKPRALLRQLVGDYATSINISHRDAWNELYKQFYYRCNESIKTKAKNLNIIPLDYLENENKLLTACSIMKELIG